MVFNFYVGVVLLFYGKMILEENFNVIVFFGFNNFFEIDIIGKRWVVFRVI